MKYKTEPTQSAELGKLHTLGVELRNEGMSKIKLYRPWTWKKLPAWVEKYFAWKLEVVALVTEVSPAQAQRIQTLNRIPETGNYRFWWAISDAHRTHLRCLERRLEVLEEILAQYSGTDWQLLPHHRKNFR